VVETTDNAGRVTLYCYDEVYRVVKTIQNPSITDTVTLCGTEGYTLSTNLDEDIIQQTVYDANGNAIASIDPLSPTTRTYYDALNRPS
jgi:YD repeat-containing protein